MAQVTRSNIFSEPRNRIVALVDDISNVADPVRGSTAEYRKWIYSRMPDVKALDFGGYPFIIVPGVGVDEPETGASLNGKSKFIDWDCEIEIFSSDRAYGHNNGKGEAYMDAISNDLWATFQDMTNRASLSSDSLKFAKITTTAVTTSIVHKERVYSRSMILSFRNRIRVSA